MKCLDDGREIKESPVKKNRDGGYNSTLMVIDTLYILVPFSVKALMYQMNQKHKTDEFSIFAKTEFDETENMFIMSDDVMIPEQKVSCAEVDYTPGDDDLSYNTVIHRHPSGCKRFSKTDTDFINRNFKFSLLWVDFSFAYGLANIKITDGVFFSAPIEIIEDIPEFKLDPKIEAQMSKVTKVTPKHGYRNGFGGYGADFSYYPALFGQLNSIGGYGYEDDLDYPTLVNDINEKNRNRKIKEDDLTSLSSLNTGRFLEGEYDSVSHAHFPKDDFELPPLAPDEL